MLIKQLKLLIPIVIGVVFLAILSSTILASNGLSAQNEWGSFYVKNDIVYFKGTLLGDTFTDYVRLTGPSKQTKVKGNIISKAKKVYAVDGVVAIIDQYGQLFAHGENKEDVLQVAGGNWNAFKFVAGDYASQVDSMIMNDKGATLKLTSGTHLVKGSHITTAGNSYEPLLSGSTTEDLIVLENTNLARTDDGRLWIGNTEGTMTAIDDIAEFNGENITDINGSSSPSDIDQMWALTDAGRLLHSTDGTTWAEAATNVLKFFHSPKGETFILKNDGTYHNSSLVDPDNFTEIPLDSIYGTLTNVMYDGDSIILHSGNDLYESTSGSDISHHYEIEPTILAGGFNQFGIHPDTGTEFDSNGDHSNGTHFDASGLASNGTEFDANGNTVDGDEWNSLGFNLAGYNNITSSYFGANHLTATGETYYNGLDWQGISAAGLDAEGFDANGYNTFTNSYFGADNLTKEDNAFHNGYDWQGLDENGFDANGYWNFTGKLFGEELGDYFCKTKSGELLADYGSGFLEDCDGFDAEGYASDGFHGTTHLDRRGFAVNGIHSISNDYFNPTDGLTIDLLEFDPQTNLTQGNSEFGSDNLTWNDEIYGTNGRDYQGFNTNGFLVDGTHRNGTLYDDEGFSLEGWNEDGVFRDGMTVDNGHLAKDFSLAHAVSRDSFFRTLIKNQTINEPGLTNLGTIFVRNNTRDGFEVSIDSYEGGVLQPTGVSAGMVDGEVPIPYAIILNREGITGQGIDETLEFDSDTLAQAQSNKSVLEVVDENGITTGIRGATILAVAGNVSSASSPTDVTYELDVNIAEDGGAMQMSGTYTDVLTITYLDR